jgi:hypothetical protein
MRRKDFKRINLWVDPPLYNQIKKKLTNLILELPPIPGSLFNRQ